MQYSSTIPSEPGYYWLRTGTDDDEIVEIWTDPALDGTVFWIHRCGSGEACELVTMSSALWAGPIEKPRSADLKGDVHGRRPRSRFT
jgi:hypothetical protein